MAGVSVDGSGGPSADYGGGGGSVGAGAGDGHIGATQVPPLPKRPVSEDLPVVAPRRRKLQGDRRPVRHADARIACAWTLRQHPAKTRGGTCTVCQEPIVGGMAKACRSERLLRGEGDGSTSFVCRAASGRTTS